MNLFILDLCPEKAAKYHCDKHVVKMILEVAQMLSTAHWIYDDKPNEKLYKKTHINHPCTKWIRENDKNYLFAYEIFINLCKEYTNRYNKIHLTEKKLKEILSNIPNNIPIMEKMTTFPQAMPDECKKNNAVDAYRKYYMKEKRDIAKWKYTEIPYWYK